MTRLAALRALLKAPLDHQDQTRIGRVQKWATPDGRERVTMVYRTLRSVLRRSA